MINYGKMADELAENVRAVIAGSGYCTVSAFCKANGLQKSSVTRIAAGKQAPTLRLLVEIANAAGVSFVELLGPEAF